MKAQGPREDSQSSPVILVADDEPVVLGVLRGILRLHGCDVLAAADAETAIELFSTRDRVDLLIADVIMPRMSGPELAQKLIERQPDLRVLLIAGFAGHPLACGAVADFGFPLLPKPFLPTELLDHIARVMTSPPARVAAAAR